MKDLQNYYGRLLTAKEMPESVKAKVKSFPAMLEKSGHWICQRCGSQVAQENRLPDQSYYCRACLVFGRITSKEELYYFDQQTFPKNDVLKWSGQLTSYQAEVSSGLLENLDQKRNTLVHAVTGAGKTEMIYRVIAKVINQGGTVGLASPRIDVCLELHQRLKNDFSCPISLLHAGSEAYQASPLVIATTHQLLRFHRAFDLLIIDEVDAFPFVDNAMLYYAVETSLKKDGVKFFLTATSTDQLDKQVKDGHLQKLDLARRFHANPLVDPQPVWLSTSMEQLAQGRFPKKFLNYMIQQRKTAYPLLIFFPHIDSGQRFSRYLQSTFPDESIAFVSSLTGDRLQVVEDFRQAKISILVSTTILERGVTFPCVDVFVMLANHQLFTKSSLVQIAGRVGRAKERPTGQLLFFHNGLNRAISKARTEIKEMNQKGGFA